MSFIIDAYFDAYKDKYILHMAQWPMGDDSYLLFIKLDVRAHLIVHRQISSDVYLVNLGIKSDIELSEVI